MLLATDLGRLLPGTHLPRRLRGPQVEETRMVSVFSFSFSLPFSLSLSFFLFRSSFRSSFFSLSFSLFRSSFCSSFRSSFFSFSSPNRVESSRIESNRIARRSYTRCRRWRDASLDGKVKRARERDRIGSWCSLGWIRAALARVHRDRLKDFILADYYSHSKRINAKGENICRPPRKFHVILRVILTNVCTAITGTLWIKRAHAHAHGRAHDYP